MKEVIKNTRKMVPLVHNITNYVTVNDVANVLLACGGSPIMSDDLMDATEITLICNALNINIGTLNERTIKTMHETLKKANAANHTCVLDPVGAGASKLRTETTLELLKTGHFDCIKGNISEIKTIFNGTGNTSGVDASELDKVTDSNLDEAIKFAKELAKKYQTIIAITGEIDIVSNSEKAYVIRNGVKMMGKITGTGCMLNGILAANLAANNNSLESAAVSVIEMGLAGEIASNRMSELDGNGSFRTYLLDAIYNMTDEMILKGAKVEQR